MSSIELKPMASKSLLQDKERTNGPSQNQLDHAITDDHLNVIATLIKEWTLLIPFLELSEQDVSVVASSSQDPTTRAVNALLRWKRRSGAQATYANLVDIFERSSNTELAARVTELPEHKPSKGVIADLKPLLQELATIPTDRWREIGLCLSLSTEELDQIASKVPARKRKREMFKTWLNQARNPTWRDVVEALTKVDPPTARSVKEEFEIDIPTAPATPSGDRQRVDEDEDRPDSGVESPEEDGVLSPSKERSPVSLSRKGPRRRTLNQRMQSPRNFSTQDSGARKESDNVVLETLKSERKVGDGEDKPGSAPEEHKQSPTAGKTLPPDLETMRKVLLSRYKKGGDSREQPPIEAAAKRLHRVSTASTSSSGSDSSQVLDIDNEQLPKCQRRASTGSTSSSGSDSSQVRDSDENRIVEDSFDHPKEENKQKDKNEDPVPGLQKMDLNNMTTLIPAHSQAV